MVSKSTRSFRLLLGLTLLVAASAPFAATAAEVRFEVGLCSCRASYDAKRYGKAQINGSVSLLTGHYDGAGIETPWVDFDEERHSYRIRFDGATKEVKQADLQAELAPIKARMAALLMQGLAALNRVAIIPELAPVRQIEAAALHSQALVSEAALRYYATLDPGLLAEPLGSHALSPQCQSYAKLLGIKDLEALLTRWTTEQKERCAVQGDPKVCLANMANSLNRWKSRKNVRFDLVKFDWYNCALNELYREAGYLSVDDRKKALMKVIFKNVRCSCED